MYRFLADALVPIPIAGQPPRPTITQTDVLAELQRGLWSRLGPGALLPLRRQDRLVGALLLDRGSPSRNSGPVLQLLEPFLVELILAAPDSPEATDPPTALLPNELRSFAERIERQGRLCYAVRVGGLPSCLDAVRRLLPEDSQAVLLPTGEVLAVFAAASVLDTDLFRRALSRALAQPEGPTEPRPITVFSLSLPKQGSARG